MTGIVYRPAHPGNFSVGRFGDRPQVLIIHVMAGSMEGTAAWFADPVSKVSAHFGVSAKGVVHQYVSVSDTAWHAGDFAVNKRSIGVEHEGMHGLEGYWRPTPEQYAASVRFAAELCKTFGIAPSRQTILLHSDVNPKKPVCPGPGFPIEEYVADVGLRLAQLAQPELAEPVNRPVRLFDPVSNTQIGEGTFVGGTDKVYVKSVGPLSATTESVAPQARVAVARGEDGTEMLGNFYRSTWVKGGILGKVVFGVIVAFLVVLLILAFSSLGRAQEVDPFNPATWFTSTEAVIGVVGIFLGWVVKLATALGKDWFKTSGGSTVALSAVMAVIIAGFGGYQMLGVFGEGAGGIQGAVQAAFVVLIAFFGSNASAKADRQAVAGGAKRLEAEDAAASAKARLQ